MRPIGDNENPSRFGFVPFRQGRFSLGLLHTSKQWQHPILVCRRMLHQCAGVWFDSANNCGGSFRPWLVFSPKRRFGQPIGTCKTDECVSLDRKWVLAENNFVQIDALHQFCSCC